MKSLLLSAAVLVSAIGAASAADLRYKAPPVPFVPAASWTGCYVGAHAGGGFAWTQNTVTARGAASTGDFAGGQGYSNPSAGFIGGGQAGCNYQMGRMVYGIEGSYTASGIRSDYTSAFGAANDVYTNRITDIASVTGRLGMAFDNWFYYSKLGWAGARATLSFSDPASSGSASAWHNGITIGSGIEYAWTRNWILGFETNYYRFESRSYDIGTAAAPYTFTSRPREVPTAVGRVSYKF